MSKVVLFGSGKIADVAYFQLTHDSPHEVVAFTVDGEHITQKEKWGLPIVAFDQILDMYPPEDFKMLVAVGYQDLNRFRARKYKEAKDKGYELISYVSSRASNFSKVEIGDNCLVLENAVLQPCSSVGNNVFFWNGNHLGHHARVEDHCYIAGQVVISGSSVVEPYCFLGVNSTIGHEVTIGRESFIGAGALITKNIAHKSVFVVSDTPKFRLDSDSFLKLTKMK
jgi:sugar O-acyltransferase (sialic acid O-acetyltransferase NeuD family)